jgi:hypothetical protein
MQPSNQLQSLFGSSRFTDHLKLRVPVQERLKSQPNHFMIIDN